MNSGSKPEHGSFVHDVAGNALSDLDPVGLLDEVAIHGAAAVVPLHGLKTAHAAVLLQPRDQQETKLSTPPKKL